MTYRVFDTGANRLLGAFSTEEEALTYARALLSTNDKGYEEDLAIGCERPDGSFTEPMSGSTLVARAEEVLAQHERVTTRGGFFSRGGSSGQGSAAPMPMAASGMSCSSPRARGVEAVSRLKRKVTG